VRGVGVESWEYLALRTFVLSASSLKRLTISTLRLYEKTGLILIPSVYIVATWSVYLYRSCYDLSAVKQRNEYSEMI
jgi:hypothetical protein